MNFKDILNTIKKSWNWIWNSDSIWSWLVALALIFVIQEHEPASFYVLDEVDAALDKHNAEKLAKLIRQYSQKAQYIMISHNDGVISEATTLYGVSMNEHGISQVVSLKV